MLAAVTRSLIRGVQQLVHRKTDLADDGAEGTSSHLTMSRNDDSPIGRTEMPQNDMAATLSINLIPELLKSPNDFSPRDDGKSRQP